MPTANPGHNKYRLVLLAMILFNSTLGAALGLWSELAERLNAAPVVLGVIGLALGAVVGVWTMRRMAEQEPPPRPAQPAPSLSAAPPRAKPVTSSPGLVPIGALSPRDESPPPRSISGSGGSSIQSLDAVIFDDEESAPDTIAMPSVAHAIEDGPSDTKPMAALPRYDAEEDAAREAPVNIGFPGAGRRPNRATNPSLPAVGGVGVHSTAQTPEVTPPKPIRPAASTLMGIPTYSQRDSIEPEAPEADPPTSPGLRPVSLSDDELEESAKNPSDLLTARGLQPISDAELEQIAAERRLKRRKNPNKQTDHSLRPPVTGSSARQAPVVPGLRRPLVAPLSESVLPAVEPQLHRPSTAPLSKPSREGDEDALLPTPSSRRSGGMLPTPSFSRAESTRKFAPSPQPKTKPRVSMPSPVAALPDDVDDSLINQSHTQTRNQWQQRTGSSESNPKLSGLASFSSERASTRPWHDGDRELLSSAEDDDDDGMVSLPGAKQHSEIPKEDPSEISALLPVGKMRREAARERARRADRTTKRIDQDLPDLHALGTGRPRRDLDEEISALMPAGRMQRQDDEDSALMPAGMINRGDHGRSPDTPQTRRGLVRPSVDDSLPAARANQLRRRGGSSAPTGRGGSREAMPLSSTRDRRAQQASSDAKADKSVQQLYDDYTGALAMCGKSASRLNFKAFSEYIDRERQKVRQRYKTNRVDMFVRIKKGKPRIVIRPLRSGD